MAADLDKRILLINPLRTTKRRNRGSRVWPVLRSGFRADHARSGSYTGLQRERVRLTVIDPAVVSSRSTHRRATKSCVYICSLFKPHAKTRKLIQHAKVRSTTQRQRLNPLPCRVAHCKQGQDAASTHSATDVFRVVSPVTQHGVRAKTRPSTWPLERWNSSSNAKACVESDSWLPSS